jgi:hypothetical protein
MRGRVSPVPQARQSWWVPGRHQRSSLVPGIIHAAGLFVRVDDVDGSSSEPQCYRVQRAWHPALMQHTNYEASDWSAYCIAIDGMNNVASVTGLTYEDACNARCHQCTGGLEHMDSHYEIPPHGMATEKCQGGDNPPILSFDLL